MVVDYLLLRYLGSFLILYLVEEIRSSGLALLFCDFCIGSPANVFRLWKGISWVTLGAVRLIVVEVGFLERRLTKNFNFQLALALS